MAPDCNRSGAILVKMSRQKITFQEEHALTTASPTSSNSKKERHIPEFVESFLDTLRQNGGMLTIFAVALICISGITLVENPANWWISVASISAFFVVVFLYMNARVFIKIGVASIATILLSSFAFKVGSYADPNGTGGLVWMCAVLFLFFGCLAYSYLVSSGRSRWGSLIGTQIIAFGVTYITAVAFENVLLGTVIGLVLGFISFFIVYKLTGASRFSKSGMPVNSLTEDFITSAIIGATENAMDSFIIEGRKEETGSIVVWREKAYLLHPVLMDKAFSAVGRKADKLGYNRKSVNPWLINVSFQETPVWKSRGASIMTVLVDLKNANGNAPRVIGVALPDTNRKLPVGVLPGKIFTSKDPEKLQKAFEMLEDEFSDFSKPITEKQKAALSRFGVPVTVEKA
jgi:hypothetical protein